MFLQAPFQSPLTISMQSIVLLTIVSSMVISFTSPVVPSSRPLQTNIQGLTRDPNDVMFYFVRSMTEKIEIRLNNVSSLQKSGWRNGVKTIILVDGFDSPRTPFYNLLTKAILQENSRNNVDIGRPNLIIVDYRKLSGRETSLAHTILSSYLYLSVLRNTEVVGGRLAEFISFLKQQGQQPISDLHLIGMSLGCHISGSAAVVLKQRYGLKIGRISGLDPARTFYPLRVVTTLRSFNEAADFIDTYHTNRGALGEIYEDTGHVNVYINGGHLQPGCGRSDYVISLPGICSHLFAYEYYAATFSQDYYGCPCNGWDCYCRLNCPDCSSDVVKVGFNITKTTRGRFHISVEDPRPGEFYRKVKRPNGEYNI